jgi:hypothetical protein
MDICAEYNLELAHLRELMTANLPLNDFDRNTTGSEIKTTLNQLQDLKTALGAVIDAAQELESYTSVWSDEPVPVFTIGQYQQMGFSAKEAPLAREYDILRNRAINGTITLVEAERLNGLDADLG